MVLNKKILYVNGCSWVEGDELKFKKNSRFSHLLSAELNLKEINLAICGCSNETIIVNTMKWIYKNQKLLNETIFIVGFTIESRSKYDWEMYDIILFQAFLQSLGVEHILFFSFGKSHKDLNINNFTDKAFYEVITQDKNNLEKVFCENGHPNEKGHRIFADYLKGWIDESE
jgi:hypothetical protein